MLNSRIPLLRHLAASSGSSAPARTQRRWARVQDVRLLATSLPRASVIERYRGKLEDKAKAEGHQDIDGLRKSYADKIQQLKVRDAGLTADAAAAAAAAAQGQASDSITHPPPPPPRAPIPAVANASAAGSNTGIKPLSAFLDLPKARTLPVRELTAVWRLRHAGDANSLCAVLPAATYKAMAAAGRQHPQFVVPVPVRQQQEAEESSSAAVDTAGQAAELHFLQWTFDDATSTSTVLFTRLAEYKLRGEFAVPHTTVTHHGDLAVDKGVVLMQGGVTEGRGVSAEEARWLVLCLHRFYGGWDGAVTEGGMGESAAARERAEERRRLLEWFGTGDERFSVEKLLDEAQRMG